MRRRLAIGILAGALLAPGTASATDGNLYPYGSSIWAAIGPFTATVLAGPVWQIQAPALSPAQAGNAWEMNWGCPVGGSEVAAVMWNALRTQAPSSLQLQVTGDRRVLWAEADGAMPQSPAGGRAYDVRLPGGNCNVHLALAQVETRNQHARGYFIDNPRILVRDVTTPSVGIRALSAGWLNGSSGLRVDWSANDNFGADGIGQHRIVIAGRAVWSGSPGEGNFGVDLGIAGIGDGVHPVQVQVDGDGTGTGSADGSISVDTTAPTAAALGSTLPGEPGAASFAWRTADNLSGVATSAVELNAAADGSATGGWVGVATADGGGDRAATVHGLRVADGIHAWRIRTTDVAGNTSVVNGPGRVVVDTTAPKLDIEAIPTAWVSRAEIDLTATDNLQATLGLGATEIDVNAASDGAETGEWLRRASTPGPAGRRIVAVDLAGIESGRHAVRIIVRNGGPFGAALSAEKRGSLRVDLTAPTISRATFSPGGGRPMTVAWVAEDAHAGVATATVQWRDGTTWRNLASEKASDGGGSLAVDVSALPDGDRAVRLVIADGAGNTATQTGTSAISGGSGAASTAADPSGRLGAAHLSITVVRARAERRGGRAVLVRRVRAGARVEIRGRLLDRAGHGIVGAEVQVIGHRGRIIGHGLTHRGGRFVIEARPVAGGFVRIGVRAGHRLLPRRASVDLRLEVRPRIALSVSSTVVSSGEEVLFSGRLSPSPADLGLGAKKGIVLEWLDPVRHSWRPVVNAKVARDGTFAIPWTFGLQGITIPMRVVVPAEVGWPLLPVRSGVIRMRVR